MIKHWINGREVESKDTFINYNPATGEAIGEVASGGAEEVAQALRQCRGQPLGGIGVEGEQRLARGDGFTGAAVDADPGAELHQVRAVQRRAEVEGDHRVTSGRGR